MKQTETVSTYINSLTKDEDTRQNLWLHYLNGAPIESLNKYLLSINADQLIENQLRKNIHYLTFILKSKELSDILSNFSDFEKSLICLLILGLKPYEISTIKGISEVRIEQSIASIRYNSCWELYYGSEKTPDRRREIWFDRGRG